LSRALRRASRRLQRKDFDIVRLALQAFLQADERLESKPADRVRGLIGSLDSGVSDLATRQCRWYASTTRSRNGESLSVSVPFKAAAGTCDPSHKELIDPGSLCPQHEQERQQVNEAAQRPQLEQRHRQEIKALQDHQKQEREAAQKRQQEERNKKVWGAPPVASSVSP
jgi:hypothetical protein